MKLTQMMSGMTIMSNIQTFTRWIDPTIEEQKKEIDRLNNVITELEKWLEEKQKEYEGTYDYYERSCYLFSKKILDKMNQLKVKDEDEK